MAAAILDRFCGPLCEAICVSQSEPFTCEIGGWEFIDWLKKENLFLIPLDAENRWFRFHHLFKNLLFNQLKRHFSAEYINDLHTNASAWFAENGLLEEALQHALAAGNTETAAGLVAEFSQQLMNDQQWSRLERCLNQLPRDRIERDPALLVLEAWLHVVWQNFAGVAECIKRIDTLNAASPPAALVNVKHVPGQFETLKGLVHYLAADGNSALSCTQRALEEIPLHHKRARLFADLYQIGAYQMIGQLDAGRILSAFREDAQGVMPGAFLHNQRSSSSYNSAFRIPTSTFHTSPSPDPQTSQPLVEPLTKRKLEVLDLLAQRLRNKEIAAKLFVSPVTIKKHLTSIYGKLNVTGRLQAIEKADTLGIFTRR